MMDWAEATVALLEILPQDQGQVNGREEEMVSRYTWEVASRLKDSWVAQHCMPPTKVYQGLSAEIVFDFEVDESVLIKITARANEVNCYMIVDGSRVLRINVEGSFDLLEPMVKEIAQWLHHVLTMEITSLH